MARSVSGRVRGRPRDVGKANLSPQTGAAT